DQRALIMRFAGTTSRCVATSALPSCVVTRLSSRHGGIDDVRRRGTKDSLVEKAREPSDRARREGVQALAVAARADRVGPRAADDRPARSHPPPAVPQAPPP